MGPIKEYTAIVMVPTIIRTARRSLSMAKRDFEHHIQTYGKAYYAKGVVRDGDVVEFHSHVAYVQAGDIQEEQPGYIPPKEAA